MVNDLKIGFIGSGKMAGAIIKGLIKTGFTSAENIKATQKETDGIELKKKNLGVEIILNNKELVNSSDVVFIAVKPNQVTEVLEDIKSAITPDKLIVSIAAGVTLDKIESSLPAGTRVIRVMPNTPALVGEGMSGIVSGTHSDNDDSEYVKKLLSAIGECVVVNDESQLDIVTAISGSGPAFFYKVINDIARAGEKLGLDYDKSLLLSIQTAIGSAKMAMHRDVSMEQLVANVATKGGCTAVGVDCMNAYNTEKLFFDVIQNTAKKANELGNLSRQLE